MLQFNNIIEVSNVSTISGLTREAKALYISNYFKKNNVSLLIVTSSTYESNYLFQAIKKYIPETLFFPMDDFLTSEAIAISPELESTRLETLNKLISTKNNIVVTNLMGYLRYLPLMKKYKDSLISISIGSEIDMKIFIQQLLLIGYEKNTLVEKTGDFAVRGFVIDIYPINFEYPIRIEFFGDEVDALHLFDPETQRTFEKIDNVIISPYTEFLIDTYEENPKQKNLPLYGTVTNISGYLPNSVIIYDNYTSLKVSYNLLMEEVMKYNEEQQLPLDTKYMHSFEELLSKKSIFFEKYDENLLNVNNTINYKMYSIDVFKNTTSFLTYLEKEQKKHKTIILCLSNRYSLNKVYDLLGNLSTIITNESEIYEDYINLIIKDISEGFIYLNYVVLSEREIFGKETSQVRYDSKFHYGNKIRNISHLNVGDYIVHMDYGIGKYLGLKSLSKNSIKKDYLVLEYKGGDKLYIPVEKLDIISKYSSNDGITPRINSLNGTEWKKTKSRIQKKLEDIAGELLELYAKRESSRGFAFSKDTEEQLSFEKEFIYDETVDQLKVSEEIKKDMESTHPMDRLLCGDVGFGKTEVAFRAMFKAVMDNKQVAYLCPTTILSSQHYTNAIDRFSHFAIRIELLNRFTSTKDVNRIKEGLQNGTVDIVIGTHRILSDDIAFKNLGLLVVDEEQRFGVKQKEKIKKFKNNIDILTLSATPIPRTLQMSMSGIRSLSLIETPPVNRYPVQTYVLSENKSVMKDVIYKELSRNGQVFILYNHVDKMEAKVKEISKLVPEARIIFANGQMPKTALESVMFKFIHHEYDILICTTIIETGIDIPAVNTLIVLEADHFGLSQLYQIRGRVGRSDKIAYCYLMYNYNKTLSEVAQKRLDVIKEFTELGSGFSIAMRDLSIRGAGDILGSEQAGFIDSIGIELYLKMLKEEIEKIKGNKVEQPIQNSQPLIDVETSISDSYVEDNDLKLEIHKKINQIDSYEMLHSIKEEIEDRFGKVNETLLIYMYEELFEKYAEKLHITKVRQTPNFIEIYIPKEITKKIDGQKLFFETNNLSKMFRFSQKFEQIIVTLDIVKLDKHFIYYLIDFIEILNDSIH